MRVALVNPPWSFAGSIYFGCREPHLPLELGYARALLAARGHSADIVDAQGDGLDFETMASVVAAIHPDIVAVTTAPSYLFWRCAPPEVRVPKRAMQVLASAGAARVVVGPHGSVTPHVVLRKLDADAVVVGECEEALVELAETPRERWADLAGVVTAESGPEVPQARAVDMQALPALRWDDDVLARHHHHHHRFDRSPHRPGAEIEASRGCPYHCTFCAKERFRNGYRKRPLATVLDELDALIARGVAYVYFIDEIFLPDRPLLEAVAERNVEFGVQLRIDNWSRDMIDLLGRAGCVSIEAGVESLSEKGRSLLNKRCKLSTEELRDLLVHAKRVVPFVQATLLESTFDDPAKVHAWRDDLRVQGVWANEPVPLFPYPGSPDYTIRWGTPDDRAWERAHEHYLRQFDKFSDIQEDRPLPLHELEDSAVDA